MPNNHQRNDRKEAKNARKLAEKEAKHPSTEAPSGQNPAESGKPDASLVEALQALAADMAKAESDADAERGLKRLQQIRADFLGRSRGPLAKEARRNAEALIQWVEARLEQLHQQLARKRRIQEGQVMEVIAKQREAEGPSLLPTELVDAVVHSTSEAEKDKGEEETVSSPAPSAENRTPEKKTEGKKLEEKKLEKKLEEKKAAEKEAEDRKRAEKSPEAVQPEAQKPAEVPPPENRPEENRPEEHRDAQPRPVEGQPENREWTKAERLAAHLAACVKENPRFFETLRDPERVRGPGVPPPDDIHKAEDYFRSIHDLSKHLVLLEMQVKAIAQAGSRGEPVSPMMRIAVKEIKGFMQDFRVGKERHPEMAEEYNRLFRGYAESFFAMRLEKGAEFLGKYRAEQMAAQNRAPQRGVNQEAEAEAPQLVLRRQEDWQQ